MGSLLKAINMKTLVVTFSLFLCIQIMEAHIYLAYGTHGRFIRLPSTKNNKLIEFPNTLTDEIVEREAIETEEEQERLALIDLINGNNNGRHLSFRRFRRV